MNDTPAPTPTDRLPDWLAEPIAVLDARRRLVVSAAVGLVLLGGIVALLAPTVLPARAVVGAAVGIAAALLATALALALDAADLVVRGARHVRAAGGAVDVRVARTPGDVGPLMAAVARHATDGPLRIALSPASRSAGVPGPRAAALAEALARTGRKVLLTDLTRGGSPAAGLSDVIAGGRSLSEVVRFEQDLYLARLAVGSDPDAAVSGFPAWVDGLPSDLEVLVVALPPLAESGVLAAAGAMDLTLVLVEVGRTERVDLIASLDAIDAAHLTSELVLVDPDREPTDEVTPTAGDASDVRPDGHEVEAPADEVDDARDVVVGTTSGATADGLDAGEVPVAAVDEAPAPITPVEDHADLLDDQPTTVVDDELLAALDAEAGHTTDQDAATTPEPLADDAWDAPADDETSEIPVPGATAGPPSDDLDASGDPDADEPPDDTHLVAEHDHEQVVEREPAPEPAIAEVSTDRTADDDDATATATRWTPRTQPATPPAAAAPTTTPSRPDAAARPSGDQPSPAPATDAPAPTPTDAPAPTPAADPDAAAAEVARTNAALYQLAQQVWSRSDG